MNLVCMPTSQIIFNINVCNYLHHNFWVCGDAESTIEANNVTPSWNSEIVLVFWSSSLQIVLNRLQQSFVSLRCSSDPKSGWWTNTGKNIPVQSNVSRFLWLIHKKIILICFQPGRSSFACAHSKYQGFKHCHTNARRIFLNFSFMFETWKCKPKFQAGTNARLKQIAETLWGVGRVAYSIWVDSCFEFCRIPATISQQPKVLPSSTSYRIIPFAQAKAPIASFSYLIQVRVWLDVASEQLM